MAETNAPDLHHYLSTLRVRKWSALVVLLVTMAAAMGASLLREPLYTAEARILVQPRSLIGAPSYVPPAPVNLETESEILGSEPVAARVRDQLGLDISLERLLQGLDVRGVPETEVLVVSYTAPDADVAAEITNAFSQSYLAYREEEAIGDVAAEEEAIELRLEGASKQLAEATAELEAARDAEDEALVATLESSRSSLLARLGILQQRLDDLRAQRASQTGSGQMIEVATAPPAPSSPNHLLNLVIGVVFGCVLGVGTAFLRERLADRLRDPSDVERVLEIPLLATVPKYQLPRGSSGLISQIQPGGAASEAYRSLRTNVQFTAQQRGFKSILVTSAAAAEGKTVTVANLAAVLAQAGRRTIVVSADMRRPTLEKYFGVASEVGLADWLASDESTPLSILCDPGIPNLRVIPSGNVPSNPAELLSSMRLPLLLRQLEENCDLVLVDTAPVLPVADAAIIASHVRASLLVARFGSTPRSAMSRAKNELERVGGTLLGCVLNASERESATYSYGGYYLDESVKPVGRDGRKRRRGRIKGRPESARVNE